ncbi:MAG: hypothetical protein ACXVZL_05010 [Gaiellaceae bacterium]
MHQYLRHQPDERTIFLSRAATAVAVLVFVGWLAWFGVAAPWDLGGKGVDVGEFVGRFFGLLVLLVAIFSPLLIAAAGGRRKP